MEIPASAMYRIGPIVTVSSTESRVELTKTRLVGDDLYQPCLLATFLSPNALPCVGASFTLNITEAASLTKSQLHVVQKTSIN